MSAWKGIYTPKQRLILAKIGMRKRQKYNKAKPVRRPSEKASR